MATLLRQWLDLALAGGWDDDTEMIVSWPSRDTAMIPLFKNHGFVPKTVIAVRPTRPAEPMTEGATVIRPIRAADIAVACDLWCEVVDWDNQFTGHPRRETTRAQLHAELVSAVTHPDTTWVAEVAGDVVGLLDLSAPSKSDWIRPVVAAAPVSYLGCLVTTASHRGAGVGAALVNQAHRAVAGFPAVANLLHYNALNPLSGPFWHRAGYRPLWTQWVRAWRG